VHCVCTHACAWT